MTSRPFTLDRTVRLVIALAVIACLFALTRTLSSVLLPFVVAWFIAYLLHPIVNFAQTKLRIKNRGLAVTFTLVVLTAVITGIIAIIVPLVRHEALEMSHLVATYVKGFQFSEFVPLEVQDMIREWLQQTDISTLIEKVNMNSIVDKLGSYVGGIIGGSVSFISGLLVVFICLLYLIFILLDYNTLHKGLREMIPQKYRSIVEGILFDLEQGMNKYFRGQALIAMSVGVLFSIGFLIMGLPLAIIVGLFIGLLNMIPYMQALGIPITMVLGILQAADTGTSYWIILIEIAAVFIVVQSIQDLILNPLIMGNVIGMNPAVMLLSLSIWGYLFGVAGMIIALPLTTVIISYYKRFVLGIKEDKDKYKDHNKETIPIGSKTEIVAENIETK